MDTLPNMFWMARDSGSLVDLRIRAHDGGRGERVAHRLGLTQAQDIIRAVNAHDDLVEALTALRNECSGTPRTTELLRLIASADAALAKTTGR